jgi:hypothetical protein
LALASTLRAAALLPALQGTGGVKATSTAVAPSFCVIRRQPPSPDLLCTTHALRLPEVLGVGLMVGLRKTPPGMSACEAAQMP